MICGKDSDIVKLEKSKGEIMKKICFIFLALTFSSFAITDVTVPKGYELIATAKGDLDKDKVDDLVLVYDTNEEGDYGVVRELQIFKNKNNKWNLWHKSRGAIMSSLEGGPAGDPFESIEINNGVLIITHYGGSRGKWGYTHKFRFQNGDFYLIGATCEEEVYPEYSGLFDYNLSTGAIEVYIDRIKDDLVIYDINDENSWYYDTKEYTDNIKPNKTYKLNEFILGNNFVKTHYSDGFYF